MKRIHIRKPDIKGKFQKLRHLKKEDIKEYWHKKKLRREAIWKREETVLLQKNAACLQNHEPIFTFAACVVRVSDQPCD